MLALRGDFDPEASGDLHATYTLGIGEDRFTVRVAGGRLTIARGEACDPDATVHTNPRTFAALLTRRQRLDQAARRGQLTLTGDAKAVQRLLDALPRPQPAAPANGG
jgi:ubiquinone biosynthesis protein UbiJ